MSSFSQPTPPEESLSILLVDDSEDDFTICSYRLRKVSSCSFEFTWAESAQQARSLLTEYSYDCIICDYQMPGEDGLSFLKWLRDNDPITPLVFFTGQGNEQIAAQALKTGANDYFTKNQEFAQFERLANSIISATQTSKRNRALKNIEGALERIDEETIYLTGEEYLVKLGELLCKQLEIAHCLIAELDEEGEYFNTIVYIRNGRSTENTAFAIAGTPCEDVLRSGYVVVSDGVASQYPTANMLKELEAKGYVGVNLYDSSARTIGLISLLHTEAIMHTGMIRSLLTTVSARAGVELERMLSVEALEESRELLNSILQDQTDFIVRYKLDGTRTFCNISYSQLWGRTEEEMLGSNIFEDLSEDTTTLLKHRISKLTPEKPVVRTLRKFPYGPQDKVRFIEWTDRALFDEDGNKVEIQSVGRDVTERIEASERHQELETHFQALFNAAGDAIFTMKDGRFIDYNPKAVEMFKYDPDDFYGKVPADISPAEQPDGVPSREKSQEYMRKALDGPISFNWVHLDANGQEFDAQVTLSRMDMRGETFLLAIVRNLTELKKSLIN